jgi:hypothetical protein
VPPSDLNFILSILAAPTYGTANQYAVNYNANSSIAGDPFLAQFFGLTSNTGYNNNFGMSGFNAAPLDQSFMNSPEALLYSMLLSSDTGDISTLFSDPIASMFAQESSTPSSSERNSRTTSSSESRTSSNTPAEREWEFDLNSLPTDENAYYHTDTNKILDKMDADLIANKYWQPLKKASGDGSLSDMLARNDLEDLRKRTDEDGNKFGLDGDGTYLARIGVIGAEAGWKGDKCFILTDEQFNKIKDQKGHGARKKILDEAIEVNRSLGHEQTVKLKAGEKYHMMIFEPGNFSNSRGVADIYETDGRDQANDPNHRNMLVFGIDDTKSSDHDANDLVIRMELGPVINDMNKNATDVSNSNDEIFINSAIKTATMGDYQDAADVPEEVKNLIDNYKNGSGSVADRRREFLEALANSSFEQKYLENLPGNEDKLNLMSLLLLGRAATKDEVANGTGETTVSAQVDKLMATDEFNYKVTHLKS